MINLVMLERSEDCMGKSFNVSSIQLSATIQIVQVIMCQTIKYLGAVEVKEREGEEYIELWK